jgi:hypothetical protein
VSIQLQQSASKQKVKTREKSSNKESQKVKEFDKQTIPNTTAHTQNNESLLISSQGTRCPLDYRQSHFRMIFDVLEFSGRRSFAQFLVRALFCSSDDEILCCASKHKNKVKSERLVVSNSLSIIIIIIHFIEWTIEFSVNFFHFSIDYSK